MTPTATGGDSLPGATVVATVKAHFRVTGYRPEDIEVLVKDLGVIGPVRTRALALPEAGGSTDIWLAFDFFGAAIAGGVVYDLAKSALRAVIGWYTKRANLWGNEPELDSIRLGFDQFTLVLALDAAYAMLSETELRSALRMIDDLREHFTADLINEHGIQCIHVLFPADEGASAETFRILVGKWAPFPTHEYNRADRRFTVLEGEPRNPFRSAPEHEPFE